MAAANDFYKMDMFAKPLSFSDKARTYTIAAALATSVAGAVVGGGLIVDRARFDAMSDLQKKLYWEGIAARDRTPQPPIVGNALRGMFAPNNANAAERGEMLPVR